MNFLGGVIVGIIIGWLTEFFLLRNRYSSETAALQTKLHSAERKAHDLEQQVQSGSAEIGTLNTRLVNMQGNHDALSADLTARQQTIADLEAQLAVQQEQFVTLQQANSDLSVQLEECAALRAQIDQANIDIEEVRTELAHAEATIAELRNARIEPDDLKRIEGIGPKVSQVLNNAGVFTFAQLASCPVEHLETTLRAAKISRIVKPDTWPEQAALAAAGDWDGLEALQDQLQGGKRRP